MQDAQGSQEVHGEEDARLQGLQILLFVNAREKMYWKQLIFWNRLHEIHTVEVNNVALNRGNDKQVVKAMV